MSKDAQNGFAVLRIVVPGPQARAQEPLVAADGTFDLPTIPVEAPVEATLHLRTILGGGRLAGPSGVQRDHGGPNAQLLTAQPMVVLGVVSGVGQKTVKGHVGRGLLDGFGELRRIVAGAAADHDASQKVRCGVADDRQLRPLLAPKGPVALAIDIVGAGVPRFKTGGVDGRLGALLDQPSGSGVLEDSSEKRLESPFFRRRLSA